jgi:hypothetical protein
MVALRESPKVNSRIFRLTLTERFGPQQKEDYSGSGTAKLPFSTARTDFPATSSIGKVRP